jgi:hypothetical protein
MEADALLSRVSSHLMDWFWSEDEKPQHISILDAWHIVEAKRKCIENEAALKRSLDRFERLIQMPTVPLTIHTTPC